MIRRLAGIAFLAYSAVGCADASLAIVNGGFETGTLSGWTVTNAAGSYTGSSFFVDSLPTTPQSQNTTVGAETGKYYAVSDTGGGPGTHVLSQSFTVPTNASKVILSYGLFVNSYGGNVTDAAKDLNFTQDANQYALVSLLSGGSSLFSTSTGVLRNFYQGTDNVDGNPNPYTNYSYDITPIALKGGTYILRFAEADNLDVLNMGVDDVSVDVTTTAATPEPSYRGMIGFALLCFGVLRFRPRNRVRD